MADRIRTATAAVVAPRDELPAVREKVAEALVEFMPEFDDGQDRELLLLTIADAAISAHLAALKVAQIATVELPEPDAPHSATVGGEPWGGPVWRRDANPGSPGGYATIASHRDQVLAAIDCLRTPGDMRWAAGALLAAADAAEVDHE